VIRTGDVVNLAEQATLGGLLLAPEHFAEVNRWIRGQDFADPWHRKVWTTLREAHAAGAPIAAEPVAAAMVARFGARLADIIRVHDLLRVVPKNPDPRPHARVVVEFGARREIATQGVLLEAGAAIAARDHTSRHLEAMLQIVAAAFTIAGDRWEDATGRHPTTLTRRLPVALRAAAADKDLRRAADKHLTHIPELTSSDVQANEARLIATLASHPTAITPTAAWLAPDTLTNPPWRTVYHALTEMADGGEHIDPVSLAAHLMRSPRRTRSAPDLAELLDAIGAETASVPGHLSRVVAGDQLRRTARTGAATLRAEAADPRIDLGHLLAGGFTLLDCLRDLAAVLPDGAGQPAPTRPRPRRTLRAGPPDHTPDHTLGHGDGPAPR
jgi:replicative DNA helicase